ncbi:MAG: stress-induced morphogen [Myxococcota bacterium]|jgi:stress-induced morphogen
MFTADRIRELIEGALPECTAIVEDPANDGAHFQARVVSPSFVGISRVRQHQLVYSALGDHMRQDIHALALRCFTPADWVG